MLTPDFIIFIFKSFDDNLMIWLLFIDLIVNNNNKKYKQINYITTFFYHYYLTSLICLFQKI